MMKAAVLLAAIACATAASAAPMTKLSLAPLAEQKALFHDWVLRHGKYYESADEFGTRFENFRATLARVDSRNAEPGQTATFGLNSLSDLSPDEFRARYLMQGFKADAQSRRPEFAETDNRVLDNDVDWRHSVGKFMGAVRNQGQCGSCWAFSTVENIASVWAIAGNPFEVLSVEQVVDCDSTDAGCNGGDPPTAYAYVQQAGGLETEKAYPYTAGNGQSGQCQSSGGKKVAQISGWKYITGSGDVASGGAIQKMKTGVVQQPLSICVEADTWQDYTGGVLSSNCGQQLDHCVILAGYSTSGSQPYWIVRNSWGTSWGISGYIYVEIGQNLCGIQNEVTTATA